jgi:hypothetical protein
MELTLRMSHLTLTEISKCAEFLTEKDSITIRPSASIKSLDNIPDMVQVSSDIPESQEDSHGGETATIDQSSMTDTLKAYLEKLPNVAIEQARVEGRSRIKPLKRSPETYLDTEKLRPDQRKLREARVKLQISSDEVKIFTEFDVLSCDQHDRMKAYQFVTMVYYAVGTPEWRKFICKTACGIWCRESSKKKAKAGVNLLMNRAISLSHKGIDWKHVFPEIPSD